MSAGVIFGKPVKLANIPPLPEANAPATGTGQMAARNDHKHERLTSTTGGTLEASGEVTVTFTRAFTKKPGITLALEEDTDGGALTWKVRNWTQNGQSEYTAVRLKVYRVQAMPTQVSNLSVLALLGAAISGLNALALSLSGFRVDQGAVGALPFTAIAVARSD